MELTFCDSLAFRLRFCVLVMGETEVLVVSLIGWDWGFGCFINRRDWGFGCFIDRWDWRFVAPWPGGTKTLWPATCGTVVLRFSERWAWGLVIQRPAGLRFPASTTGDAEGYRFNDRLDWSIVLQWWMRCNMNFEDYSSRTVQLCVSLIRDQALARKWISGPSKARRILIHFTGMENCSDTNEKKRVYP